MSTSPDPTPDTPFQLLVVGDFSGRGVGGRPGRAVDDAGGSPPDARPVRVTSVDGFMERIRPTVELRLPGAARAPVAFERIEDFHPDRLLERVPHLYQLLGAIDPLVEEHEAWAGPGRTEEVAPRAAPERDEDETSGEPAGAGKDPPTSTDGLLDEIVEATASGGDDAPRETATEPHVADLQAWVRELVTPHLTRPESAGQQALRERLEEEVSVHLRAVLHAQPVRSLEASWRSLLALAATVTSVPDARLFALDLPRRALDETLLAGDPAASPLGRALTEALPGPAGAAPFAVAVLAFDFGPEPSDVLVLNRAAMVAHSAGVPLLAGAAPAIVGLDAFEAGGERDAGGAEDRGRGGDVDDDRPAWAAFRATEAARSVGLLAPRVLLRLPYGEETDPCEALPFEEASGEHGEYLWGNAAFVAAEALVLHFSQRGWRLDASASRDFAPRPLHVGEGGRVLAHPVERVGRSNEERRFRASGITPLLAFRETARMRLATLASVARPPTPLAAWWAS